MTHRQRVENIMNRQPVDIPAVQYYYTDVGVHEHGEKLNDFFAAHPGDFAPFSRIPPPILPAEAFASDGRYYDVQKDAWGTVWEYRIYGRMGHAVGFPIADLSAYKSYQFPPLPAYCCDSDVFASEKERLRIEKQDYFTFRGEGYSILERLFALRGFENTMMDLLEDGPEINGFLDRLTEYYLQSVIKLLDMGADCITFGDDYGTQNGLLLSPGLFCHSIAPRLRRLMEPVREAGRKIHFHSCGRVIDLFPVFEELGVNSVWPQIPAYDMRELAEACQKHRLALAIHTDRAVTMTSGTPDAVRELVRREAELFRPLEGKAWFYVEVDHGFPYENIVALVEEIYRMRERP